MYVLDLILYEERMQVANGELSLLIYIYTIAADGIRPLFKGTVAGDF